MNNLKSERALAALALIATTLLLGACHSNRDNSPGSWRGAEIHFRELDRNDDGVVRMDELDSELALYQEFTRYDTDGTGAIELDEFYDYVKDRRD
jgi:hypothetical protein